MTAAPSSAWDTTTLTATVTPTPARIAPQSWLGTVVRVSDDPDSPPTTDDDSDNQTIQWLQANAWQFGFVPALPETDAGAAIGHEPWTFRWIGRSMAAQMQPLVSSADYGANARRVFEHAEAELASPARADTREWTSAVVRAP